MSRLALAIIAVLSVFPSSSPPPVVLKKGMWVKKRRHNNHRHSDQTSKAATSPRRQCEADRPVREKREKAEAPPIRSYTINWYKQMEAEAWRECEATWPLLQQATKDRLRARCEEALVRDGVAFSALTRHPPACGSDDGYMRYLGDASRIYRRDRRRLLLAVANTKKAEQLCDYLQGVLDQFRGKASRFLRARLSRAGRYQSDADFVLQGRANTKANRDLRKKDVASRYVQLNKAGVKPLARRQCEKKSRQQAKQEIQDALRDERSGYADAVYYYKLKRAYLSPAVAQRLPRKKYREMTRISFTYFI